MKAFKVLHDHVVSLSNEKIDAFCQECFDYGDIAEDIAAAYRELTNSDMPDYLEHHGFFAYHLAETARSQDERQKLLRYAENMLTTLVEFNLSQNSIYVE